MNFEYFSSLISWSLKIYTSQAIITALHVVILNSIYQEKENIQSVRYKDQLLINHIFRHA